MNVLVCTLARNAVNLVSRYGSGTGQRDYLSTLPVQSKSTSPQELRNKAMGFDSVRMSPTGHEDNLLSLLELNLSDSLGRTALHWAAATDQAEMVQCLLEAGAPCDAQTIYDETPLALAAKEGAVASCRLLLMVGANPDLADYLDRCPAVLAEQSGHTEVLHLFEQLETVGPTASSECNYVPRTVLDMSEEYTQCLMKTYGNSFNSKIPSNLYKQTCKPHNTPKPHSDTSRRSTSTFKSLKHSHPAISQDSSTIGWCSKIEPNCLSSTIPLEHNAYAKHVNNSVFNTSDSFYVPEFKTDRSPLSSTTSTHLELLNTKIQSIVPRLQTPKQLHNQYIHQMKEEPEQVESVPVGREHRKLGNHFMNSDSESPNRWSSSPSDTSPKQNRPPAQLNPVANEHPRVHISLLSSHTTDVKSYATADPSRAFQVLYQ